MDFFPVHDDGEESVEMLENKFWSILLERGSCRCKFNDFPERMKRGKPRKSVAEEPEKFLDFIEISRRMKMLIYCFLPSRA